MPDLILHHYPMSPFSDKFCVVLGFRQQVRVHCPRVGYASKLEATS
jgi:hypothetical protein